MSDSSTSFRLIYSDAGEADLEAAYRYMLRYGYQTAEQWLAGLNVFLRRECELQAVLPVRRPSLPDFTDRNVYVLRYITRGGSQWRVLCELNDIDEDGEADTLFIVGIRHAVIGPPSSQEEQARHLRRAGEVVEHHDKVAHARQDHENVP